MIRKHYNNSTIEGKVIDFHKNGRYWENPNSYKLRVIIMDTDNPIIYPIGDIRLINSRTAIELIDNIKERVAKAI